MLSCHDQLAYRSAVIRCRMRERNQSKQAIPVNAMSPSHISPMSLLLHQLASKYALARTKVQNIHRYAKKSRNIYCRQSQKLCDCPRQAHADANSMSGRFQKHFCKGYDLQAFAETKSFSSDINDGLVE